MEELIQRAVNGDKDAYTILIKNMQQDLFRIANTKLKNIEDINDAIQETIIISFDKLHTLKHTEYFKTWLIKILINQCNNIYRKRYKQLNIFNKLLNNNMNDFIEETSIQKKENELDFDILLKNLNYDEKIVIILYYNNNFSTKEIADILNTNVNTIKSRLTRAKKKLKSYYAEGGYYHESRK